MNITYNNINLPYQSRPGLKTTIVIIHKLPVEREKLTTGYNKFNNKKKMFDNNDNNI